MIRYIRLLGAALGGLDDRAHLLRGRTRDARRFRRPLLGLALEVVDGVRQLAEVLVDLVGVIAATGRWEILTGDVPAIELHAAQD